MWCHTDLVNIIHHTYINKHKEKERMNEESQSLKSIVTGPKH